VVALVDQARRPGDAFAEWAVSEAFGVQIDGHLADVVGERGANAP
jgi:hypothetical protein